MRTSTRVITGFAATAVSFGAGGCGTDSGTAPSGRAASRTIDITMADNAFQPTTLQVAKGETVLLRFRNTGAVRHEAILGDDTAQMRHHDEMTASTAEMGHGNPGHGAAGSPDAMVVEPGRTGEMAHTFAGPGTVFIGCHEPGHWEAGMKATVTVG